MQNFVITIVILSADIRLGTWINFFNIEGIVVLTVLCDVALTKGEKKKQNNHKTTHTPGKNKQANKTKPSKQTTPPQQPTANPRLRPKSLFSLQMDTYNLNITFC